MIEVILKIIGVIMNFILLIGGIVFENKNIIMLYGVLGLIYGLFIFMFSYRIIQQTIKD